MSKGPLVKKKPRKRNQDGTWRKKRSDAVTKAKRAKKQKPTLDNIPLIIEDRRVRVSRLCKEIQDMTKEGII